MIGRRVPHPTPGREGWLRSRPQEGTDVYVAFATAPLSGWRVVLTTPVATIEGDRKSTRLNSSHLVISYAVFCLKKKKHASLTSDTLRSANLASHDHVHDSVTATNMAVCDEGVHDEIHLVPAGAHTLDSEVAMVP